MLTPPEHLPSLQALASDDDRLLSGELRLLAARRQLAVVRTLADQLERALVTDDGVAAMREQLAHEQARLRCRTMEVAAGIGGGEATMTQARSTMRR